MGWLRHAPVVRGRVPRVVAGLWLAAGIIVWNLVFDRMIVNGGREYVYRQQLHERKRGPAVTIDEIMRPARGAAFRSATLASLLVMGLGAGGTACVTARRRSRRPVAPPPASAPSGPAGPR